MPPPQTHGDGGLSVRNRPPCLKAWVRGLVGRVGRFGRAGFGRADPSDRQALEPFELLQFVANRRLFFILGATGPETV